MDSTYVDVGLIYHIGVYSMYILNLYWFTKMIKKFCRTMEKHIVVRNTDIINLSQYVYFIIPFYNILSIKTNITYYYFIRFNISWYILLFLSICTMLIIIDLWSKKLE